MTSLAETVPAITNHVRATIKPSMMVEICNVGDSYNMPEDGPLMYWIQQRQQPGIVVTNSPVTEKQGDVEAGTWSGVRLKNLPKAAVLDVIVQTDGEIKVNLTDSSITDQENRSKPLFAGLVNKRMSFTVSTVKAGDHYIILDNRDGKDIRSVDLTVRAQRGDDNASANETLSRFEAVLHKIFMFDPIKISVAPCEKPNAYSVKGNIILCADYVNRVHGELNDKEKTRDVLVFALFHEVGHTLLEQWNYPFYDSEDVSDQFAVAVLVMLDQEERIEPVIELFSS